MGKKLLRLLLLLPLFSPGQSGAGTSGTLIGTVSAYRTGEPVEGALVVLSGPKLQQEQTAVTDAAGSYRVVLLPPGDYRLSVQVEGFLPAERSDIRISVDKTLRANVVLLPDTVEMGPVPVPAGIPPVIDVGSAEIGVVLNSDFISSVPVGRSFDATALVAPGVDRDAYGFGFNGATSPENAVLLDGLNLTDPAFGTFGTVNSNFWMAPASGLLTNFVEQIEVKTGAYLPEYGHTTGGIVNVLTKSGSNEFHGSIFGNLTPYALSPAAKPVTGSRQAVSNEVVNNRSYQADFGFELGGPLLKDRLWFYVGFAPVFYETTYDRYLSALTEDPAHPGQPLKDPATDIPRTLRLAGTDRLKVATQRDDQFLGKLTYLLDENQTLSATAFLEPTRQRSYLGIGTAQRTLVQDPYPGADSARYISQSGYALDTVARYSGKFLDKHLILEGQLGLHRQKSGTDPTTIDGVDQAQTSLVNWGLEHSLADFEPVPAACLDTASFRPCPVSHYMTGGIGYTEDTLLDRYSAKLSASGLFEAAGHHVLKGGLELEQTRFRHATRFTGGVTVLEDSVARLGGPVFMYYRDYTKGQVTDPNDPAGFAFLDTLTTTSVGNDRAVFLQDSWSILDRLTLNAGIRWEVQDLRGSPDGPAMIDIRDNFAPRVQVIYDFTGEGRGKVSAHWGRFYETIPLDIADRAFGGAYGVAATLSHCVEPSPNVAGAPASCPIIPNGTPNGAGYSTLAGGYTTAVPVAPDLKGQYVDQFGGSIEYALLPDLAVGFSYLGVRLGRVIEDMSADDGATYFIANPGESKPFTVNGALVDPGLATTQDPSTLRTIQVPFPKPERSYDGFTFQVRKSFSSHWLALASYTYSSLRGNYPGLYDPDNHNQLDPNYTPEYDLVTLLANRNGPLPADRPHHVKLYGAYVFDLGPRMHLTAGGAFQALSGTPVDINGSHPIYGPGMSFILPRGSGGRTPTLTQLDLHGGWDYLLAPPYTLRFTIDVFNVLNQQAATAVDNNYTYDPVQPIAGGSCKNRNAAGSKNPVAAAQADCPGLAYARTPDGRPITVNQNFGRPTAYQLPLSVRLGLALSF